jgi:hypothetical protein
MTDQNTGNTGNPNPATSGTPSPDQSKGTPQGTGVTGTPSPVGGQQTGLTQPAGGKQPDSQPTGDTGGQQQTVPLRALQEEREKRQALQTRVEQLTQYVQQIAHNPGATTYGNAPQSPSQAHSGTNAGSQVDIDKLWESDPRKAVQATIQQSLSTYDSINASLESQASYLSNKYPDFNEYRQTAMNYLRTLPYDQRAQDGIVELAYMVARGQNVDNLIKTREQQLMEKFQRGELAGSMTGTPAGAAGMTMVPGDQPQLTADQKVAAEAMGISEADYIASMSRK